MFIVENLSTRVSTPFVRSSVVIGTTLVLSFLSGWQIASQYGISTPLLLILGAMTILILTKPVVGVYVLVFTIPFQNVFDFGEVTATRLIGIVVFGAWGFGMLARRDSWTVLFSNKILKPALLFAIFTMASLVWAEHLPSAIEAYLTIVQLLLMLVLIVAIIDTWDRLEWVIRLTIMGGLVASVLTISQLFFQGVARAGDGVGAGGINHVATQLVIIIPLSFFLIRTSRSPYWRLVGLSYIIISILAVAATMSRTSFLILPLVLASQIWLMSKSGRRALFQILLIGLIGGTVLFLSVPWDRVLERGSTIVTIFQTPVDDEIRLNTGRTHIWLGALAIFADKPLLGAGIGNFGHQFATFQFLIPSEFRSKIDSSNKRSPHSTFFGFLAEIGLIGILLWVLLHLTAFNNLRRSSLVSDQRPGRERLKILIEVLTVTLVAYTLYSILTVTDNHKLFWVLLSLTEVVRRLTASQPQDVAQGAAVG